MSQIIYHPAAALIKYRVIFGQDVFQVRLGIKILLALSPENNYGPGDFLKQLFGV